MNNKSNKIQIILLIIYLMKKNIFHFYVKLIKIKFIDKLLFFF